jgi:hypothetical protein
MQEKERYRTDAAVRQECANKTGAASVRQQMMPKVKASVARAEFKLERVDMYISCSKRQMETWRAIITESKGIRDSRFGHRVLHRFHVAGVVNTTPQKTRRKRNPMFHSCGSIFLVTAIGFLRVRSSPRDRGMTGWSPFTDTKRAPESSWQPGAERAKLRAFGLQRSASMRHSRLLSGNGTESGFRGAENDLDFESRVSNQKAGAFLFHVAKILPAAHYIQDFVMKDNFGPVSCGKFRNKS